MADHQSLPAERMPSRAGEISALASAGAPFLFFERASFYGLSHGLVGQVTLVAERQIGIGAEGGVARDLVIVAHLRAAVPVLRSLARAVAGLLTMAGSPEGEPRGPHLTKATHVAGGPVSPRAEAPPVEAMPSRVGDISALASASAPVLYFDHVPFYGFGDGIGRVTLVAQRHMMRDAAGIVQGDFIAVAHLRASPAAYAALRTAIDGILLMSAPAPSALSN